MVDLFIDCLKCHFMFLFLHLNQLYQSCRSNYNFVYPFKKHDDEFVNKYYKIKILSLNIALPQAPKESQWKNFRKQNIGTQFCICLPLAIDMLPFKDIFSDSLKRRSSSRSRA